jgi:hypothetical protein
MRLAGKIITFAFCALLLRSSFRAEAQQPTKLPRIGLLSGAANPARPILWEPFFEALREMGYVERTNIIMSDGLRVGRTSGFLSLLPTWCI